MVAKSPILRLDHILEAIQAVREYTGGLDLAAFARNRLVRQAVERNLEIISEASRHIPDAERDRHPAVPWRRIADIGNVIRHQYYEIDYRILWDITQAELIALETVVRDIKSRLR